MEVTASWFVAALRTLGRPYVRQNMAVDATGDAIRYRSWPTEPGGAGGHDITVCPDTPLVCRRPAGLIDALDGMNAARGDHSGPGGGGGDG